MVFSCHFSPFWGDRIIANSAWTGVDLFYVLSGFLITGILYDSVEDPRYFRNFYVRRALRIFPLFYGFFLLLFLLAPILHLHYQRTILEWVFYVGNVFLPFIKGTNHNPTAISVLYQGRLRELLNIGSFWSLCVEEQFYLLWPMVIWLARDRKRIMRICVATCIAVLIGRCFLEAYAPNNHFLLFWSTYTRCDTLLVGAWLAVFLRGRPLSTNQIRRCSALLFWISVGLLCIGYACTYRSYNFLWNPFTMTVGYTLIALAAAGVLLRCLDETSRFSRVLMNPRLTAFGAISYGFYFFHSLPLPVWDHIAIWHPHLRIAIPILAFVATWAVAKLSFRFWESPFLRLKSVLAPQRAMVREHGQLVPTQLHVPEPTPE
jgi:peptidoglycan/LPS O-acetylase OafA/YrhL